MAFLILYCNARVKQESIQSTKKPSCIPIGDLCNDVVDCCGNDDPDVGHCVYCRTSWPFGRHQRCDCSSSGAVTTTDDGIVNSDRCAGRDRRLNRCRVSVARPGTFWARGNNVHPKKTKNAGQNVLLTYYDSTFNGAYFGMKRTFYKIRDRYYWPNQFLDIKNHMLSCLNCKKNNHLRRKPDGFLQPITPPQGIMEKVAMDFEGKLPTSAHGN
ncbi:unnamed protein product [Rotaria sp. Silwood2]|nr:unnamed protein product [Rotaria sp. Silwood2]